MCSDRLFDLWYIEDLSTWSNPINNFSAAVKFPKPCIRDGSCQVYTYKHYEFISQIVQLPAVRDVAILQIGCVRLCMPLVIFSAPDGGNGCWPAIRGTAGRLSPHHGRPSLARRSRRGNIGRAWLVFDWTGKVEPVISFRFRHNHSRYILRSFLEIISR